MCHRPTCRKEGVLLDYSTDGGEVTACILFIIISFWFCLFFNLFCPSGVSWTLLHEMDYLKYVSVRRDYIVLPEGALTNATRLRWWQPFTISSGLATPSLERAQWAIDNILVGGSDINPPTLLDTFDDGELVCADVITASHCKWINVLEMRSSPSSLSLSFNRGCFPWGELEFLP